MITDEDFELFSFPPSLHPSTPGIELLIPMPTKLAALLRILRGFEPIMMLIIILFVVLLLLYLSFIGLFIFTAKENKL